MGVTRRTVLILNIKFCMWAGEEDCCSLHARRGDARGHSERTRCDEHHDRRNPRRHCQEGLLRRVVRPPRRGTLHGTGAHNLNPFALYYLCFKKKRISVRVRLYFYVRFYLSFHNHDNPALNVMQGMSDPMDRTQSVDECIEEIEVRKLNLFFVCLFMCLLRVLDCLFS